MEMVSPQVVELAKIFGVAAPSAIISLVILIGVMRLLGKVADNFILRLKELEDRHKEERKRDIEDRKSEMGLILDEYKKEIRKNRKAWKEANIAWKEASKVLTALHEAITESHPHKRP